MNSSESNPLASPGRSLTEWVMLQPFPEAPAHTWNHMPHVRGAAEQPLLQTISGTTINDGLPCLYKLLDKSETTWKYLWTNMKTVWQGESDHGSTTRLDAQDISIAHVQCTEWLSVQGGSTPKINKTIEKCLAEWIRSLQYYHTTFTTFTTVKLTLWILQSPTHLLLLVGLSLSEWCYNRSQKHLHRHGTTCLMLGGLLSNPCYKQSQAPP